MGSIARFTRDLDIAEDSVQEAFVRASKTWPTSGLPENPGAWLHTVARNVAIDLLRKRKREVSGLDNEGDSVESTSAPPSTSAAPSETSATLGLVFACCRVEIPDKTKMTLALRLVLGLTTRECARILLEDEPTTAQRLVRAKRLLRDMGERFEPPPQEAWAPHIQLAATFVYLLFTEGYAATHGVRPTREDLTERAIDLGRLLVDAAPTPATFGLLSLMLLHRARAGARVDAEGRLVTLNDQDRSKWHLPSIEEGLRFLDQAIAKTPRMTGPNEHPDAFVLQAAIAALHCRAPSSAETDWPQIAGLYGGLLRVLPTPMVELNAAVALAMAGRLDAGLRWLNELERRGELPNSHLLALAKAELLFMGGTTKQAERYFRRARRLATNSAEQRHIDDRVQRLFSENEGKTNTENGAPEST